MIARPSFRCSSPCRSLQLRGSISMGTQSTAGLIKTGSLIEHTEKPYKKIRSHSPYWSANECIENIDTVFHINWYLRFFCFADNSIPLDLRRQGENWPTDPRSSGAEYCSKRLFSSDFDADSFAGTSMVTTMSLGVKQYHSRHAPNEQTNNAGA